MMKICLLWAVLTLAAHTTVSAQELYVFTEPASNMAAHSLGIRITDMGMPNNDFRNRFTPEIMFGFSKNLMVHTQGFFSNLDGSYKFEGGSIYAKYRFYTNDQIQTHFRMAAFGRVSGSRRGTFSRDINLTGDNSGLQGGLIFTQLLHKVAFSSTVGFAHAFKDLDRQTIGAPQPNNMLNYSVSTGYLLAPKVYTNYKQANFNVYLELLGKTEPESGRSYFDIAPAAQIILNSRTLIDLGYRFEAAGNLENRFNKNSWLVRLEFNFYNVL